MNDCLDLRDRHFAPPADRTRDPGQLLEWELHLQECADCRRIQESIPAVDQALGELGREAVAVPPFDRIANEAERAARHQRGRQVMRRSVPFLYTGLATAAVAAGLVAAVMISRGRSQAPLLDPGAEIQATGEAKAAVLENGARLRLDSGRVKLVSSGKQSSVLVLTLGRVSLDVPKLARGASLSVRTPDAEVVVRGTRFQVTRTDKETQVHVFEGRVDVRPEGLGRPARIVGPGESATVGSADAYREDLRKMTLAALDRGQLELAERRIADLAGSSATSTQQAEAQALLAWSLAARGNRASAIERYQQALSLLPNGEQALWAQNACAELAILLEQARPHAASGAWADCLRRFPHGVHAAAATSRSRD